MGIRRVIGSIISVHHFAAEFCLNRIATQPHQNLAKGTCRLFPNIPRPKYSVSPRTRNSVEQLSKSTPIWRLLTLWSSLLARSTSTFGKNATQKKIPNKPVLNSYQIPHLNWHFIDLYIHTFDQGSVSGGVMPTVYLLCWPVRPVQMLREKTVPSKPVKNS